MPAMKFAGGRSIVRKEDAPLRRGPSAAKPMRGKPRRRLALARRAIPAMA